MSNQVIRLIYPPSLLSVPIINQLIRTFDVTVNILRAQITADQAWLDIQLTGSPVVVEEAITWLKSLGIQVQFRDE